MEFRKQTSRGRTGLIKPVKYTLVKALTGLREKNYRASEDKNRYSLTAREMVVLGKLINAWKDVVGLQLAKKTCPTRLIKGKLYLAVADSQWMQTLIFLKDKIIAKLAHLFPDISINEIIGKPGKIPEEVEKLVKDAEWPDWQQESAAAIAEVTDPELASLLVRCRQKLSARLKGLEERGFKLCRNCRAAVTISGDETCAMCKFNNRTDSLMQVRVILRDMPWLTHDELNEFDPKLNSGEYLGIRLALLEESLESIDELAAELSVDFVETTFVRLKKEMARAVMLHTGKMPDEVDVSNLRSEDTPDLRWTDILAMFPGENEC